MSAGGQATRSREIPAVRRVAIHDSAHMPQDYSTTPGGTVFSTTPGGTRIIYDRKFLLQCRSSPLTRTPPKLPDIPGCHQADKTHLFLRLAAGLTRPRTTTPSTASHTEGECR
ncbi:eukaryotic translation initiation factor 4E-binding protein 1-like [Takifugu rubripes]|uniref:Eukaryotic translation initiation factor 4E binding protein 1 n=1 Tax=Takifugu rubripes TaxID=31033 RepID=A0A674PBT6_TAKRU|nr:eukaryotic translation initiation factor 4E-binding protein 1-like [Takifugu rubripes]